MISLIDFEKSRDYLSWQDQIIKPIIEEIGAINLQSTQNVFHDVLSCIIEQQIHYRSTKNIFRNILARAELSFLTPENFEEFERKALTQLKISMLKLETLTNLHAFFSKNPVRWQELETSEIQAILGSIPGVGPWSVDMILLYTLNRTGIFPAQDFHLRKILYARYPMETFGSEKKRTLALAELWKEHQSAAVLYWLEAKKQKIIKV